MHHGSQLYYVPNRTQQFTESKYRSPAAEWMVPMTKFIPSTIVEVPAASGFVGPHVVERLWKEQFDFFYREYESFVFPTSVHPQVSGKLRVILMHERLIEYINSHDGVEWCTFDKMVKLLKDGELDAAAGEGGADTSTEKMAAGPRFRTRQRNSIGITASVLQGFPAKDC